MSNIDDQLMYVRKLKELYLEKYVECVRDEIRMEQEQELERSDE